MRGLNFNPASVNCDLCIVLNFRFAARVSGETYEANINFHSGTVDCKTLLIILKKSQVCLFEIYGSVLLNAAKWIKFLSVQRFAVIVS